MGAHRILRNSRVEQEIAQLSIPHMHDARQSRPLDQVKTHADWFVESATCDWNKKLQVQQHHCLQTQITLHYMCYLPGTVKPKTTTCEPALTDPYREMTALQRQITMLQCYSGPGDWLFQRGGCLTQQTGSTVQQHGTPTNSGLYCVMTVLSKGRYTTSLLCVICSHGE